MNYTLKGKIARAHPYQLDPTLTVYGAGAEAEATGKAIKAAVKEHADSTTNPHKVTKSQVGLGKVDNTTDMEKPVSEEQKAAITKAKEEAISVANEKATTETLKAVILASDWSNSAPFTQTVTVEGILSDDYPFVDIDLSEVNDALPVIEGWNMVGRITTSADNEVTVYCYEEAPAVDIPIVFKVVR